MLQFQTTKNVDLVRLSKLLVLYNVNAEITDTLITLTGDISENLLEKLCSCVDVKAIQNFAGEAEKVKDESPEEAEVKEDLANSNLISTFTQDYDLLFPTVKRGEVYLTDFGDPYGSEQGYKRPAIIIQNDCGNSHSSTTIVIPISSELTKASLPTHYTFNFSEENMVDYLPTKFQFKQSIVLAEQIRTIAKCRLRKYLGTLTPEFMKIIQEKIDISLALDREIKTEIKTVVETKTEYIRVPATNSQENKSKDLNMVQVELLSFVDISKLLQISKSVSTDEVKVSKILELFGFDANKNGIQYLEKAIIASPKADYFNLDSLTESISKEESIGKEEIKRLIVARVKENFKFKKSPTIDFIRLVNSFLKKETED